MACISYKKGYKYQLAKTYTISTPINNCVDLESPSGFISLSADGELTIHSGYAWDGPSGPTIDTKNFMRGSLVHDALYQLMREGLLDNDIMRDPSDRLLQKICQEDGMSLLRSWWVYKGLKIGGHAAASPKNRVEIIQAPIACHEVN